MRIKIVKITKKHKEAWYNDRIGTIFFVIQYKSHLAIDSNPNKKKDQKHWRVLEVSNILHGVKLTKDQTIYLIRKSDCKIIGSTTLA